MRDDLFEQLRRLGLRGTPAVSDPGMVGVSLAAAHTDRFLGLVARDENDALTARMWAHPSTGWDGQEWRFEASAYPPGPDEVTGLFVTVHLPESDVPEVVTRLREIE